MEKKKPFADRLEAFFAGKGFYIVLFLCVAVIGVSAWSILSGVGPKEGPDNDMSMAVSRVDENRVAAEAAGKPLPTALPEVPPPVSTCTPMLPESAAPAATPAAPAAAERDYYIWPVSGAVENGYSMAALTFSRTMQDWRTHDGLDIAAELGTQVKAAANGQVAEIFADELFGTTVVLSHRDGLVSVYANLAETPTVTVGQQVGVGQVIGAVGDTALAEAGEVCHLHFAMRLDGVSVDPTDYMP